MRLAPEALARGLILALVACGLMAGCGRQDAPPAVQVGWTIDPAPPSMSGETTVQVTLHDNSKQPIRGARLQLEAHMAHPGMTPVTAAMTESGDGVYAGHVRFSMAGDWLLVVTGQLADGSRITRQLELPGVQAPG